MSAPDLRAMADYLADLRLELDQAEALRRTAQAAYEDAEQRLQDLQAFIYTNLQQNPEIKWQNPNPVLLADGTTPMPEYEAQYRTMLANFLIQENTAFQELMKERNTTKEAYYEADKNVVSIMEELGVSKAEMALVAALLRLADDS